MSAAINCVLIGHDYIHEMQVIAQIFFPNSSFAFHNELPKKGYAVVGSISGVQFSGELYRDGIVLTEHHMEVTETDLKTIKRSLMLALFYALRKATKRPIPWGALTGVRPAKQVRMWLEEGDKESEIFERLSKVYMCRDDKINLALEVAKAEKELIKQQKPGIGLYIGIPFCPSRCLYCSFVTANQKYDERYLDALERELSGIDKKINMIYIGGGTPTSLPEAELERLLKMVAPFVDKAEYTVEAGRPDSITSEKLKLLKAYGVGRIAINPQTLNDETLKRIGRAHTVQDFYKAYELAVKTGFDNINTDVIAGLPGESAKDMQNTMRGLLELAPKHITIHTLAIKRASRLNEHRDNYPPTDFKDVDEMLSIARDCTQKLNLRPYYMYRQKNMLGLFENVGYSLPGYESQYNVATMAETQTILAVGAGGITKIIEGSRIERAFNPKNIETYIERMGQL